MSSWSITASDTAVNTINPIRKIVDMIKPPEHHDLPLIDLALGDPSVFGNLEPHPNTKAAITSALDHPRSQGYTHSCGVPEARDAVAHFMKRDQVNYQRDDIILTSGASHALLLTFQFLLNRGDYILLPKPSFSLYETLAHHLGAHVIFYDLSPQSSWEIDLIKLRTLIIQHREQGHNIKGLLLNNPGNPTGCNYSRQHLIDLQQIVSEMHLPVIADEIYSYLVFPGQIFTSFASLSEDVPVFVINGLAKQFLVPGWRLGWIALCDRGGYISLKDRQHLISLTQVVLGSSTVIQHALPQILAPFQDMSSPTAVQHYTTLCNTLSHQADILIQAMANIPGLSCVIPHGAMYVMIHIDTSQFNQQFITNDVTFCQLLLQEENIKLLPGSAFGAPDFFRVVICAPEDAMNEFAHRLHRFCHTYQNHNSLQVPTTSPPPTTEQ